MKLKVIKSIPIWQSDDGIRTKYHVLSEGGQIYATWSKVIGQADRGSEFEVMVEERDFNGRKEKYVKQQTAARENYGSRQATPPRDRDSIERQVALKCAVEFAISRSQMKAADITNLAEAFDQFLKKGAERTSEKLPWE
jgi:hypothetical protein